MWGGLAKFDLNRLKGHADLLIPVLQRIETYAWLSFLTVSLTALATLGMKAVGPPWVREAIKTVLNEMHTYAFRDQHRAEFHDRITLFRHVSFCIRSGKTSLSPFGGHLIPFVRSGFMTQRCSVAFKARENGHYEGVAGFAYCTNVSVDRENLPDVSPGANPSDSDFDKYAEETFVDPVWLRKERSTARSLYGIPVRVDGKPWGAIVVDSRQVSIENRKAVIESYTLVAKVLGELIRRS